MYWERRPYVSAAERKRKAQRAMQRASKGGKAFEPVVIATRAIANTFWGKAWCGNLERWSDFENRLPRGRTYVRNGSVIDLKIAAGRVDAEVMGSSRYRVRIEIDRVAKPRWAALVSDCTGSVASLIDLLQGTFSDAVMARMCAPDTGLFPAPKQIRFECSCPDWAVMCKHVAAVLYGVGARLDNRPELLFILRQVDANDLLAASAKGLAPRTGASDRDRVLEDSALGDIFGIDVTPVVDSPARARTVGAVRRTTAPRAAETSPAARKAGKSPIRAASNRPATTTARATGQTAIKETKESAAAWSEAKVSSRTAPAETASGTKQVSRKTSAKKTSAKKASPKKASSMNASAKKKAGQKKKSTQKKVVNKKSIGKAVGKQSVGGVRR